MSCLISSAERVSRSRGKGRGRPPEAFVRFLLMLLCKPGAAIWRFANEGEADGDVDMRSLSGSSEAFLLRPLMVGVLKGSETWRCCQQRLSNLKGIYISAPYVPERDGERRRFTRR